MLNYLIGKVHIQLEEGECRTGANCVSSDLKLLFDAPYMLVTSVHSLLYHSLNVSVVCLDEPSLRLGTGCLDCELPKP